MDERIYSCNGKLRDKLLNDVIFYSLMETKVIIKRWYDHYNTMRPHSSLKYRPPAPQANAPSEGSSIAR